MAAETISARRLGEKVGRLLTLTTPGVGGHRGRLLVLRCLAGWRLVSFCYLCFLNHQHRLPPLPLPPLLPARCGLPRGTVTRGRHAAIGSRVHKPRESIARESSSARDAFCNAFLGHDRFGLEINT